MLSFTARSNDC